MQEQWIEETNNKVIEEGHEGSGSILGSERLKDGSYQRGFLTLPLQLLLPITKGGSNNNKSSGQSSMSASF